MSRCVFCGRTKEEVESGGDYYYEQITLPFVFHCEQNEGRNVEAPYISPYKVAACERCLIQGSGFYGYGALGFNQYSIAINRAGLEDVHDRVQQGVEECIACKNRKIAELNSLISFSRKHPVKHLLSCLPPFRQFREL